MKRRVLIGFGVVTLVAAAVVWAAVQMENARGAGMSAMMPDGALLYVEAKDFRSLLNDWNESSEKRIWLTGEDYQAFSRSRLFGRLQQSQDEFSAVAGLAADSPFLMTVAGKQSSLALYDIGNLQFVYLTRMPEHDVESTPLWQLRSRFEQRSAGSAQFFVRQDLQSNRTAAFAQHDGWLILGTRADLVAGVLERMQGAHEHSLADETWYAETIGQSSEPAGELRMILNLDKLVPSPYFRSYWVQRNSSEMKQYSAALSDLYRSKDNYREERLLLRKAGAPSGPQANVQWLASVAPEDAAFYAAQASPGVERVAREMRENLLDAKPAQAEMQWTAPPAVTAENVGSASMLEERIDQAPVLAERSGPNEPLHALLQTARPVAFLKTYATRAGKDGIFVSIDRGIAVACENSWDAAAVQQVLSAALRPGLTAASLGLDWTARSSAAGDSFSLNGRVPLFFAVRGKVLLAANSLDMLEKMIARLKDAPAAAQEGITYTAVFHHSAQEQQNFRSIAARLDRAGGKPDTGQADAPAFFSRNIASLSRMFSAIDSESVVEKDRGAKVTQTVVYRWSSR